MSTDLIEFLEIKNLFLKIQNDNYKINENNNLSIEEEIVQQLLLFISTILKNKKSHYEHYEYYELKIRIQIVLGSLMLLKKINKSTLSNIL